MPGKRKNDEIDLWVLAKVQEVLGGAALFPDLDKTMEQCGGDYLDWLEVAMAAEDEHGVEIDNLKIADQPLKRLASEIRKLKSKN